MNDNEPNTYSRLEDIPEHLECIWTNVKTLRMWVASQEEALIVAGQTTYSEGRTPFSSNRNNAIIGVARSHLMPDLVNSKALLQVLEASPQFIEADEIIEPLIKAKRETDAKRAAEVRAKQQAEADARAVLEAAREKAAKDAESHPEVIRAQEKLAKIESANAS